MAVIVFRDFVLVASLIVTPLLPMPFVLALVLIAPVLLPLPLCQCISKHIVSTPCITLNVFDKHFLVVCMYRRISDT